MTRRSSPARARPGSHAAAREEAILAAAADLVDEIGYERVTVDAIAARAHSSKATMYRKWPSKADLVADALRRRADGRAAELADTGDVRGDLLLAVGSIARTFAGGDGLSLPGMVEAVRADPALRDLIRTQIDARTQQDGTLICARAVRRAEHIDATQGATALGLAFAHLFLRTLLDGEPPGEAQQRSLVDQILLPLLTARG